MTEPGALEWIMATVSAAVAVALSVVLAVGWRSMYPVVTTHAGRLFLRLGAAVLGLGVLHHVAMMGSALWGARPHLNTVVDAALAAMGGVAAGLAWRHGGLLRHLADSPGLLRFAMARATVAEAALSDLRGDVLGDVREAVSDASGRVGRVESRLVRDADATALIAKLIAQLSTAAIVVGADGALVVVTGNESFWKLSAIPRRSGVRLADALCLDDRESSRLLSLFTCEGASVVVRAVARDGAARRMELQTVYLPAERGGRMWVVCRPMA